MFNAASTAPAPSPYGTASRHNIQKAEEMENPNKATAVIRTLTAVTNPAPNFFVRRSDNRLEITVPMAMIIEIIPA